MTQDLIIQQPAHPAEHPPELFLMFHGVGASPHDLRALGKAVARQLPQAWVVSVRSPDPSDLGAGWQWFSVRGVNADNRAERVAAAMPGFLSAVAGWQRTAGSGPAQTTLLGFSQGAIMALEASQLPAGVACRAVALAGRLSQPTRRADPCVQIHLLHGEADSIVPAAGSVEAHAQLQALGASVSLDLVPGLGHGVDARMATRLRMPSTGSEDTAVSLPTSPLALARHWRPGRPPTLAQLEQAIDATEAAISTTAVRQADRGPLVWQTEPGQALPGQAPGQHHWSRDEIEQLFGALVAAPWQAQGEPAATLLLRELLHHLGFAALRRVDGKPAHPTC